MARIEDRDMWLEGKISDDAFDTLKGDLVRSSIVARETGDGIHEVMTGGIAKMKEGAN